MNPFQYTVLFKKGSDYVGALRGLVHRGQRRILQRTDGYIMVETRRRFLYHVLFRAELVGYMGLGNTQHIPWNENQLDALFVLSLFRQSTSTCFGHICSPSSGCILYIYNNLYVLCFLVDWLLASIHHNPANRQWTKNTTRKNYCIHYTVHLLMMGYKCARNM